MTAPEPGGFPPPHRRLTLKLSVQADDLEELGTALAEVQQALAFEGRENWQSSYEGIWSGYHLTLICDDSMNAELHREQVARHRGAVQAGQVDRVGGL